MSQADFLTLVTALFGVALLVVLVVRTVLKEMAVGRRSTDTASARTERIRTLDLVAVGLTVLTAIGAIWRIVVGLTL
ncbi:MULTISPECIES: hypothetical protein [Amycolatopsis]|uniref:Uncharacterized protein n=2 Tax=Amycolatopsis TaxID=1813 RepID=A0A3N2GMQ9_9PSEU|nr:MULTISPECIES: hypothetical protein [Amycolatopsis]MCF6422110.1 hypothetical protein [Amycolatopsis tucumanensis]ROS37926.1 hypothetical protein EDD35_0185 [Amycolatopsis thermoflava]